MEFFFFKNCHAVRDHFGVKSSSVLSASGLLAANGEEDIGIGVGELGDDDVSGEDIAPGDTDPNLGDHHN